MSKHKAISEVALLVYLLTLEVTKENEVAEEAMNQVWRVFWGKRQNLD